MRARIVLVLLVPILVAVPAAAQSGIDLQKRLQDVAIHSSLHGYSVEVPGPRGPERLDPEQFVARLHAAHRERERASWLYRFLNITTPAGFVWISIGFLGQALFTFRMLLQWLASEKQHRSIVPVGFWWGSLFGGLMLLAYFIWRKDIVGVVGQSTGTFIYVRNLVLIYNRPAGDEKSP